MRLLDSEVRALGDGHAAVHDGWLGPELARAAHHEAERIAGAGALRPAGMSRGAGHRVDADTRGDAIVCSVAPYAARFVTFERRDFFRIVKTKFGLADR